MVLGELLYGFFVARGACRSSCNYWADGSRALSACGVSSVGPKMMFAGWTSTK